MDLTAVHQVVAGSAPHDAITNHVLATQEILRGWGRRSEVIAGGVHPDLADRIAHMSRTREIVRPGDAVILHYSIDSPAFAEAAAAATRLGLWYHNITPAELLWRHSPRVAAECARGRRHLPDFAATVIASCADSGYNAAELAEVGYRDPVTVGILAPELPLPPPAPRPPGPPRLLFVGRGIPNKGQRDLVLATAALHEAGCPAELSLVGSWGASPAYRAECEALAARLGVGRHVRFLGSLSDAALGAAYRESDVFVCLSEHEGYCVPLLEAMRADLPIVAFAAAAVPETLGDAGLLLPEKTPSVVAEAILEVLDNAALLAAMARARPRRLEALGPGPVTERLRAFVDAIV